MTKYILARDRCDHKPIEILSSYIRSFTVGLKLVPEMLSRGVWVGVVVVLRPESCTGLLRQL